MKENRAIRNVGKLFQKVLRLPVTYHLSLNSLPSTQHPTPVTLFVPLSPLTSHLSPNTSRPQSAIRNPQWSSGQALLELAIFGGITLAALGFLIRVGMKMNFDQEIRMAAFRRALAAAYADNCTHDDAYGALYYYRADRQMPNPSDGFMAMPRVKTEATGFVEWGDRLSLASKDWNPNTQPKIVARSNDKEEIIPYDEIPNDVTTETPNGATKLIAFKGIVRESHTHNGTGVGRCQNINSGETVQPTIIQTHAGTTLQLPEEGIDTCADTTLNTRTEKVLSNRIASKEQTVSWPTPPPD